MSQSVDPAPTASPEPLWRDRNFRTMWTGQALSQLGEEILGWRFRCSPSYY